MIRSLTGTISSLTDTGVVVEVNNIGYLIYTPTTKHPYVPGDTVLFHTHLVVRETVLDLYGFSSLDELNFFQLLITVPKIGPKSALQILTQADVSLLSTAILQQDPDHLHKMAGIGKKTASNIVSALSGKVETLNQLNPEMVPLDIKLSAAQIDAIDALITLGYDPKEARTYILKLDKNENVQALIQSVLKQKPIS